MNLFSLCELLVDVEWERSVKLPGGLDVSRLKEKPLDDAIFNESFFPRSTGLGPLCLVPLLALATFRGMLVCVL